MKYHVDGDALCITRDDFVDLQSSPAVFIDVASEVAQTIIKKGLRGLTVGELADIEGQLRGGHDRLKALVAAKLHKLMGCLAEEREKWLFHQLLIRCDRCKEIVPIERATLLVDGPKYGVIVHPTSVSETLEISLEEYTAVLCEACRRVTEEKG